jgi:uncharacterized protein with GYD domain
METYIMTVKYSSEGARGISAKRTQKAQGLIQEAGGKLVAGYGVLGKIDVVLVVELPGAKAALKFAMKLGALLGATTETMSAVSLDEMDQIAEE